MITKELITFSLKLASSKHAELTESNLGAYSADLDNRRQLISSRCTTKINQERPLFRAFSKIS